MVIVPRNVMVGDLVFLMDESTPLCLWLFALVIETKTSRDGIVRCVRVKTNALRNWCAQSQRLCFLKHLGKMVLLLIYTDAIIHNTNKF